MSYTIIKHADSDARKKFTYTPETVDEWRSHAKDVYAGLPWKGDCDDLASTVCHIAIDSGISKECLWFAMVSSNGGKKVDHLVGLAKVGDLYYVIGDTSADGVYPLSRMKHKLLYVHSLDWEPTHWERRL